MNRLIAKYAELLDDCFEDRTYFKEEEICPSFMACGKKYNNKLLIVGRAANGGGNAIRKDDLEGYSWLKNEVVPKMGSEDLKWVDDQRGSDAKYNPNKSAFWRVTTALSAKLSMVDDDHLQHIAVSNLYKITQDGGNPSTRLADVQFHRCVEILKIELELLKPENVILLTGASYAKDFLERLGVENQKDTSDAEFVTLVARLNGTTYVVSERPEGRDEQKLLDEVLRFLV